MRRSRRLKSRVCTPATDDREAACRRRVNTRFACGDAGISIDLDRPVPRELIFECLELALQAPTGFNEQNWRWLVITDPDKRRAIGEIYRRILMPFLHAVEQQTPADDEGTRRVAASSRFLGDHLAEVPVHVILCTVNPVAATRDLFAELGYETDLWNMAGSAVFGELWPAAWSFMLALRARGLGSSATMIHLGAEAEVARLLHIPEDVSQAGLIPVAYFKGEGFTRGPRRALGEVGFQDRWGEPLSPT